MQQAELGQRVQGRWWLQKKGYGVTISFLSDFLGS